MRQFISISTIAILLTAAACAPEEKIEASCPRPPDTEQLLRSAQLILSYKTGHDTGIFFLAVEPDSFWACAGIQENALITQINARPVPEGAEIVEMLELITQDAPVEFSVLDPSGERRIIAVR